MLITIYQIKKNNEENIKRDSENLRIQNMPMLKYKIEASSDSHKKISIDNFIDTKCKEEESKTYDLFISIKNIGLNNVKRIIVFLNQKF